MRNNTADKVMKYLNKFSITDKMIIQRIIDYNQLCRELIDYIDHQNETNENKDLTEKSFSLQR